MERRKFSTKLSVSPSFSIPGGDGSGVASNNHYDRRRDFAGGSSPQIVDDNFSGPISSFKEPKSEIHWFDLSPIDDNVLLGSNPYELRPLPDLLSFEHPVPDPITETLQYPPQYISSGDLFPVIESSCKRFRPSPSSPSPSAGCMPIFRSRKPPSSEIARRRRSKISDRIKILEGLMPWDARMTMGTTLEEAHKYIRFLEAQVTALQTMPVQFSPARAGPVRRVDRSSGSFGGLEMLNRQQMLQVMVNSAAVQDLLYKNECCVFSAEQVAELRRRTGEGRLPLMFHPGSTSSASN